jgi:hypothetical protein
VKFKFICRPRLFIHADDILLVKEFSSFYFNMKKKFTFHDFVWLIDAREKIIQCLFVKRFLVKIQMKADVVDCVTY